MLLRNFCASRMLRSLSLAGVLAIAGCVTGPSTDPGLEQAIKAHYAAHATEESGACRAPRIDTVQNHQLIKRGDDGAEVMKVRYSYFDRHADMDADWQKLVYLSQPCGGIAERDFSLVRGPVGYKVVAMSGERRGSDGVR